MGVVGKRKVSLAEKIVIALDKYGRESDKVEYGLPVDPDFPDLSKGKGLKMLKIVENIIENGK